MIRVLLLSDSHGDIKNMATAVQRVKPDLILHMGDCWNDAVKLKKKFRNIPMETVIGNCDWYDQGPVEKILEIEGYRIMMCHGHTYNVKRSLLQIQLAAKEKRADIVVFGHTHQVYYDRYDGLALFNPGSIGAPIPGNPPSYGILTLDETTGLLRMETGYME